MISLGNFNVITIANADDIIYTREKKMRERRNQFRRRITKLPKSVYTAKVERPEIGN